MSWLVAGVLFVVCTVLATRGAQLMTVDGRRRADVEDSADEAADRRAVRAFVLTATATACGAVGAAVLAAGAGAGWGPLLAALLVAALLVVGPMTGILLLSHRPGHRTER